MSSKTRKLLAILPLALALAACSTTESGVAEAQAKADSIAIEKGMSSADLVAAIGEPAERRPVDPPHPDFEVWVYRKSQTNVKLVATGVKETPYVNPITGESTSIKDLTYGQERESVETVTEFLIGEGVVVSWKQAVKRGSSLE